MTPDKQAPVLEGCLIKDHTTEHSSKTLGALVSMLSHAEAVL